MLQKTRGLVLSYIRYRETSVIVRIYTEAFGLQSYIENGVRSSKGRNKIALFQPLTLLDMVVYHKEQGGIQRLSEVRVSPPYRSIPFELRKATMALFMTELLGKVLQEEEGNPALFDFLQESLLWLDAAEDRYESFHLWFLLQLSFYLGFQPASARQLAEELQQGGYAPPPDELLAVLDDVRHDPAATVPRAARNELLEWLVIFFRLHIEDMSEVRSLEVLQTVFS